MQSFPKAGDRIRLVAMPHDPDPIPTGSLGTVVAVYNHGNWAQIDVDWDSGRTLMLSLPDDCVAIINPASNRQSQ